MSETLRARARSLLVDAVAAAGDAATAAALRSAAARLDEPLRVAIAGKVKAGKSTLLNALVGEELAPTDAGECTRIVTWYHDGITYRIELVPRDGGPPVQVPFERVDGVLTVQLGDWDAAAVERLDVTWPSQRLRELTLVDTPGIDSASADVSRRTIEFLAPDDGRATDADAVLYLMRHLHAADVRFLESFHDDELAQASPVNALGVLSRADEVGACRPDAMRSAARIAARYDADPKIRRLCATVVPVAGLVAQAAATLSEGEFRAVARLAAAPDDALEDVLLSVDRFLAAPAAVAVEPAERAGLLERLGLFGVRIGIEAVRTGTAPTASALAAHLAEVSGIGALRRELGERFAARAGVLQARSALAAFDAVAAAGGLAGPGVAELVSRRERIEAEAHELTELRVLDVLRQGGLKLKDDEVAAAERLVRGGSPGERVGLAADAPDDDVRRAASDAMARWQARAENPLSSQPVKDVARVLVRSLEGLLADA